jgi:hypothetical protein
VSTMAAVVSAGVAAVVLAVVRGEHAHVPRYVTVGRIAFLLLGVGLLRTDPGVAVLALFAAFLGRLRERSYADRFRARAEALAQYDGSAVECSIDHDV